MWNDFHNLNSLCFQHVKEVLIHFEMMLLCNLVDFNFRLYARKDTKVPQKLSIKSHCFNVIKMYHIGI